VPVDRDGALVRNPELVALEPGGDIRVGFGVHVGVDADADRGATVFGQRHGVEYLQLGLALHVEAANACAQGLAHFGAGFAHARKDHLAGIAACGQHAVEFTA